MKFLLSIFCAITLSFSSEELIVKAGEDLLLNQCSKCHNLTEKALDTDKAPLMTNIVKNIKFKIKGNVDQKNYIYKFLADPNSCSLTNKVLCPYHSTEKFGKMDKVNLSDKETILIVNYLIDHYKPITKD